MTAITELGYIALGVSNLAKWQEFAAEVLGLEVVNEGEPRRRYLRMDFWHHRFILDEDGSDDLNALGLRVSDAEAFDAMEVKLRDNGLAVRVCSRQESDDRHVLQLMRLEDPNGNPIEIFHGPHVQYSKPFYPGRRMYGKFLTGSGGLGHCILRNHDLDKTYKFYRLLGMIGGIEYRIPTPDGKVIEAMFFHCNDRDHTVAFGLGGRKRLNHVMIEAESFDDFAFTYELVRSRKIPIGITPGKHSNDHQYTFYFLNPSGWLIEYGWGSRPATRQSEYYSEDFYGHEFQPDVLTPSWDARQVAEPIFSQ